LVQRCRRIFLQISSQATNNKQKKHPPASISSLRKETDLSIFKGTFKGGTISRSPQPEILITHPETHEQELVPEPVVEKKPEKKQKKGKALKKVKVKKTKKTKKETVKKEKQSSEWDKKLELYQQGVNNKSIQIWVSKNRKLYRDKGLSEEKIEKLKAIDFSFDIPKKINDNWERQLALWKKGERNALQQWRQRSVKLYVDGKLRKDRIAKLREVGILK